MLTRLNDQFSQQIFTYATDTGEGEDLYQEQSLLRLIF